MFTSGMQRQVYHEIGKKFELEYPEFELKIKALEQEEYKAKANDLLSNNENYSDIFFWFAGNKLRYFSSKNLIHDISPLWTKYQWKKSFGQNFESVVSYSGRQYALPIHVYHWGMYYRKSIFKDFDLTPPENWAQLMEICEKLSGKGKDAIAPFALGSKNGWPLAGWFDYLNMRLNGGKFHQSILEGTSSFSDPRVKRTLSHLKHIHDHGYFLKQHSELDWNEALPFFYRKKAAMMLMGNFWTAQIPKEFKDDIGFFQFPSLNKVQKKKYEDAPTDVLVIPQNAKNKKGASLFLAFVARPANQTQLNIKIGMLPPNIQSSTADDYFLRQGQKILSSSEGILQFFDRDADPKFSSKAMSLLQHYLKNNEKPESIMKKLVNLQESSSSD